MTTNGGIVVMMGACVLPRPKVEFINPGISQYGFRQQGKFWSTTRRQYCGMGG